MKPIIYTLGVLVAAVSLLAAAEVPETLPQARVQGQGSVWARPDLATLWFTVDTEAPRVAEATSANARQADALVAAVKKLLPKAEDIHSLSFRVEPVYAAPERGKKLRIVGYKVSHTFRVRLTDIHRLAEVLDTGLAQGATQVQGPRWEHSQLPELQRQAAAQALAQARKMAEALAQTEKLKVKRLRQVATQAAGPPYPRGLAGAKVFDEAAATPITVGEEEISAQVEAIFELQ